MTELTDSSIKIYDKLHYYYNANIILSVFTFKKSGDNILENYSEYETTRNIEMKAKLFMQVKPDSPKTQSH